MKYFKAAITTQDTQKWYGNLPYGFVIGYEDEYTQEAFFGLLDEVKIPDGAAITSITEEEYKMAIEGIEKQDKEEREKDYLETLQIIQQKQEDMRMIKNQLLTADEKYNLLDKATVSLEEIKVAKIAQLSEKCREAIVSGFTHAFNEVMYHFSFDTEAQGNFSGTQVLFSDNLITEVEWTVQVDGVYDRLVLTKEMFNELALKAFGEKNDKVKHFRNVLAPLVVAATTNAEVDAVTWS